MTQQKPAGARSPRRIVNRREWQDALKAGAHGLKPGWAHAAVTLLMWMDQDGACFPGQEKLAAAMGKSSRAVRDDLAWLEHVGWVNVRQGGRRGDRHESSRYQSTLPTGTVVPAGARIQTGGFSADYPSPNRHAGTPQPEPTDGPTGTQVPGNSQKNSQGDSQTKPAADAGSLPPGSHADASRRAAADADGTLQRRTNADGIRAVRAALQQAAQLSHGAGHERQQPSSSWGTTGGRTPADLHKQGTERMPSPLPETPSRHQPTGESPC